MTMTSNYDKYIRPEVWPVAPERAVSVHIGGHRPDDMVEVRAFIALGGANAARLVILTTVPREDGLGAANSIAAYCEACRKLIG